MVRKMSFFEDKPVQSLLSGIRSPAKKKADKTRDAFRGESSDDPAKHI